MPSWRERESEKQARSRADNESTARARVAGSGHALGSRSFRCECGAQDCACAISLTLAEYESVRAFATRFVITPNHENPESERIVAENTRFAVVEEVTAAEMMRARKSNPRRLPAAPARR
jgi:hypothetical protein